MCKAFARALTLTFTLSVIGFITPLQSVSASNLHEALGNQDSLSTLLDQPIEKQLHNYYNLARQKRESDTRHVHRYSGDVWVFESLQNQRGCPRATRQFKIFTTSTGDHYAIIATQAEGNNTEIYTFHKDKGCGKLLAVLPVQSVFDFEALPGKDSVRIVTLEQQPRKHPHLRTGSPVFSLTFNGSNVLVSPGEILRGEQPACLTSWNQDGSSHLAICDGKSRDAKTNFTTVCSIYRYSRGYFDQYDEIQTHLPQSITHFRIFSKHYLAIANRPHESEREDVPTEILRYDLGLETYRHLQFLPTKGAKDICFFSLGSGLNAEFFLAVVNEFSFDLNGKVTKKVTSFIYKFIDEKFEPFQSIPLSNQEPTGCVAYQVGSGQVALIISTAVGVEMIQYNGWRFVRTSGYSNHALGQGIARMNVAFDGSDSLLLAANNNPMLADTDNVFVPKFRNHVTTTHENNLKACQNTKSKLKNDPIGVILSLYDKAVKKDDTQVRLGNVEFRNLTAKKVFTEEVEVKSNSSRLGKKQIVLLQNLAKKIDDLTSELDKLNFKVKNSIRTTGNYAILGSVNIANLTVNCPRGCNVKDVTTDFINSENVTTLLDTVIKSSDKHIPPINVTRLTVHHADTPVLSDKPIAQFIRTDGDVVLGTLSVTGAVVINSNLAVNGLIDNCTVSPSHVLLRSGNQLFDWSLSVDKLYADKVDVEKLNGQDLNYLYRNVLTSGADFTLRNPHFRSLIASEIDVDGLVNRIDINELMQNSMKLKGDQVVSGTHSYDAADLGEATLRGTLNDKDLEDDFLLVRKGDEIRIKNLKLEGDAVFTKMKVSSRLGNMPIGLNRDFTQKFLLKSSKETQLVTGAKKFLDVRTGSAISSSTLNTLPMDKFDSNKTRYGDPKRKLKFNTIQVEGSVSFGKPLLVKEMAGVDLDRLNLTIPLSTQNLTDLQSLTFTNNLKIEKDLSVDMLEDVPTTAFLLKDSLNPIVITGSKTFAQSISITRAFELSNTLNGYNLTELWDQALKIDGDQALAGSLRVEGNLQATRLYASNPAPVSLSYVGDLSGTKKFHGLTISDGWHAGTLQLNGLFNEMDVNTWPNDTIMKQSSDQVINSTKSLKRVIVDHLHVSAVDDVNINELVGVAILNQPTEIHSDIVFHGPVSTVNMTVRGTINDVESDAPLYWLKHGKDQKIEGSINVEGLLTVQKYRQDSWMINDFNVEEFKKRSLRIDEQSEVPSMNFDHVIVDNLVVDGLIQGLDISKDFVLKSSEQSIQRIEGHKVFAAPLTSESLEISNELNGKEPDVACHSKVPPQSSHWVIYGNLIVKGSNKFSIESINNRTVTDILTNAWIKDEDVDVKSRQGFERAIIGGTLDKDVISGISLSKLDRDAVKLKIPSVQIVKTVHQYDAVEVKSELVVKNLISAEINNIKLKDLQEKVLLITTPQELPESLVFENVEASEIHLDGLFNGLDIEDVVARKSSRHAVRGIKVFENLVVENDVEMCSRCLVGSYDISDWAKRAVLNNGSFTLAGGHFESMSFQQPITLKGQLNGAKVDRNSLLTLSDNQTVAGSITLASHLPNDTHLSAKKGSGYQNAVEGFSLAGRFRNLEVKGSYGGVDLARFYEKAIRQNMEITFSKPVVLSSLAAEEIADAANASTIRDITKGPTNGTYHTAVSNITPFNISAEKVPLTTLVENIEKVVSHRTFELKFFEEIQLKPQILLGFFAAHAWESSIGNIELSLVNDRGQVFLTPNFNTPVLESVEVTGMASSNQTFGDLAIAALNGTMDGRNSSFIVSLAKRREILEIPTSQPLSCAYLPLGNQSCFVFLEKEKDSPVICRSESDQFYNRSFELKIEGGYSMVAGYNSANNEPPILAVSKVPLGGNSQVDIWKFNQANDVYELWKNILTMEIRSMDSICDESVCLLATVAPSKPAAIPGQVNVWSLNDKESPSRLQHITFAEPIQAKFAILPDGRKILIVLQSSGVDNVSVFIQRDMQQFRLVTTVRVPGAKDLKVVVGSSHVTLVFSIGASTVSSYAPVRLFRARFLGQFV